MTIALHHIIIYTILFISNGALLCQNDVAHYFKNNSLVINEGRLLEKTNDLGLYNYQAYFFGEDHNIESMVHKEKLMIGLLKNKVNTIFVEYPIGYYNSYIEYMNQNPTDTSSNDFKFLSDSNISQETLLRYIYRENIGRNIKYSFTPIDMNDFLNIDELLDLFATKKKPKLVKEGFRYLKKIKKYKVINEDLLLGRYTVFRNNFYANLTVYKSYLKDNFNEMQRNIDGIYTYSIAKKEDSICACRSVTREEFMLKNIMQKVKEDSTRNFISINGAFHIPLTIQYGWENVEEWESLAAKFKKSNPSVKVCSIYFMKRGSNDFEEEYFPNEKKILLENTKPDETYLIRLDGENTPFKELSEKFQYIVVW